jgi:hypothetical protein
MESYVHHIVHKSPLCVHILSQTKAVHALSFYFCKIRFNNIHPTTHSPVCLNKNVSSNDHVSWRNTDRNKCTYMHAKNIFLERILTVSSHKVGIGLRPKCYHLIMNKY